MECFGKLLLFVGTLNRWAEIKRQYFVKSQRTNIDIKDKAKLLNKLKTETVP